MKFVIGILLLIGAALVTFGTIGYVEALGNEELIGTFFGMLFTMGIIVLGGVVLLVDLVIFLIYISRKKSKLKSS